MSKPTSAFFVDPLYSRMADDLHLGGMSQRTHDGYLRAVRQLADYCQTSPDEISEEQLRRYFLYLKNEKQFAYTVPDRIGWVLRGSQADGYAALFDAGAESMVDVGSATKSLRGCRLGFFGLLRAPIADRRIGRGDVIPWFITLTFTSSFPAAE